MEGRILVDISSEIWLFLEHGFRGVQNQAFSQLIWHLKTRNIHAGNSKIESFIDASWIEWGWGFLRFTEYDNVSCAGSHESTDV